MKWVVDKHIKNFPAWSGAVDTLDNVKRAGGEYLDKLENLIQTEFEMETPTDTQINDLLWFEPEYIYSKIGLTEDGEIPNEDDEGAIEVKIWWDSYDIEKNIPNDNALVRKQIAEELEYNDEKGRKPLGFNFAEVGFLEENDGATATYQVTNLKWE